ncbi:MAG TPA: ABC transporter permease [Terriglobia bacterium]
MCRIPSNWSISTAPIARQRLSRPVSATFPSTRSVSNACEPSGDFFSGLGVRIERGRGFTLEDETEHTQVAVLSYDYWARRLARNPAVIGQTLYVKAVPFTIIGVAAEGFRGVEPWTPTEIWIPLQNRADLTARGIPAEDGPTLYGSPKWWCLLMVGRLEPGVSWERAIAQLTPVFRGAAYEGIGTPNPKDRPPQIYLSSARGIQVMRERLKDPLLILTAMVGLVLLIVCLNVAVLVLARNEARQREFSLRMALGSARSRLFRQLLTESLLLVAGGWALGWTLAVWVTRALATSSELVPDVTPDRTVLWFALAVSAAGTVVFGLIPLRSAIRGPLGLALKSASPGAARDIGTLRGARPAVAVQVSLCVVLLGAAGLLVRTLRNLERVNLGFRASALLVFGINPPATARTDTELIRFYQALRDRLRSLPSVESATLTQVRIGSGGSDKTRVVVDGDPPREDGQGLPMFWNAVGPHCFHVLGAQMLMGRDFTEADSAGSPKVGIVNETFARSYLAGRTPLGHTVAFTDGGESSRYSIVGVVADNKYSDVREHDVATAYFPYTQVHNAAGLGMNFELQTEGPALAVLPEVRRALRDLAPDQPLLDPLTQQEQFEESFLPERIFARLAAVFGFLAVVLVAGGLYGTLACRVGRRTAEIGVRMALGAEGAQILWMVLRDSLTVSAGGIAVGLPLAIACARLLRSMLFGVDPADLLTFTGVTAGIALVALGAGYLPARRAAHVDPMVALRHE